MYYRAPRIFRAVRVPLYSGSGLKAIPLAGVTKSSGRVFYRVPRIVEWKESRSKTRSLKGGRDARLFPGRLRAPPRNRERFPPGGRGDRDGPPLPSPGEGGPPFRRLPVPGL